MDETTQQNAALVEEVTAAAREMEEQAQHLGTAVAIFRTGAAAPAAAPAAPRKTVGQKRAPVRAAATAVETEWETF